MSKDVILTGLRANSELHLGNYLGALLPIVNTAKVHSDNYQVNLMVADLHSFITPVEHSKLYDQIMQNLRVYAAAGLPLDNDDIRIFRQSYIPAHSELAWIFDCFSGFGELSRMTEFKDKSLRQENVSVGLFNYPPLMAADILLYGAKWVPVGEDQRQHLEFTRDLAMRMNNKFGDLFVVPEDNAKQTEFSGRTEPVRIRSLRNPDKKMSKSVDDPAGTILLSDSPDEAAQKVTSATTDSVGAIHWDWENQHGITNLLQILVLLSGRSKDEVVAEWDNKSSYGELKAEVAEAVRHFLRDFHQKLDQVDHKQLMDKLQADEAAMSSIANETLERVQQAVGLRPKS